MVSLVNQFKGTNKSQNGRIACALRNLTCYLGNAQRMEKDGIIQAILELSDDSNLDVQQHCKCSSEGAAREWSTVVDIFIPPLSSKPVLLSLSRSHLSKTPKQVFFNPINIFDSFTHTLFTVL